MILDLISQSRVYESIHPLFPKAFEWLKNISEKDLTTGRHTIAGDDLFALVSEYQTRPLVNGKPESHRKYADIQIIVSGSELVGWEPLEKQEIAEPFSDELDVVFYKGSPALFQLITGMFAVFFPADVHMPCIEADSGKTVKKVVIKVKVA